MDKESEYVLVGTENQLADILKSEFGFNEETSKLATLVLLRQNADYNVDDKKEYYDLWFLSNENSYTMPLPFLNDGAVTISLKKFALDILKSLCDIAVEYVCLGATPDVTLIRDIVLLLWNNIDVVSPDLRCVYFSALKWKRKHKRQHFSSEDLIPECIEQVCVFLDKTVEINKKRDDNDWVCSQKNGEYCRLASIDEDEKRRIIKEQLDCLRDSGIIKEFSKDNYDFAL